MDQTENYYLGFNVAEWSIASIIFMVGLFVVVFIFVGLVVATGNDSCPEFDSEEIDNMLKLSNASLYPYMGNWNRELTDISNESQCIKSCVDDDDCIAFYRHNENGRSGDQDKCYFYTTNNVRNLVETNIELSSFFNTTKIRVGYELPEYSTDVYIKKGNNFRQIRSKVNNPSIAI
jgi:hypothetical protein